MKISLIAAASENGVIGKAGQIPWFQSEDQKLFARLTRGHAVIMGRKTYQSIVDKLKGPLPKRKNIVLTRQEGFSAPQCEIARSIEEALKKSEGDDEAFVIGGSDIYEASLPLADRIYLTTIHGEIEGDAFFPKIDLSAWKETARESRARDEKNQYDYTFITYERP